MGELQKALEGIKELRLQGGSEANGGLGGEDKEEGVEAGGLG